MDTWWITNTVNYLEGDPDNTSDPVRLPDAYIIDFLRRIPAARTEFCQLLPTLSVGAQTRLNALLAKHPFINSLVQDRYEGADQFQKRMNQTPVYTAGPIKRGG